MSIKLTTTPAAILEADLKVELENERANEADYLAYVQDPLHKDRPIVGLPEIRESIEILTLKYEETKRLADAERGKLGSSDEIRAILTETRTAEANARKSLTQAREAACEAERLAVVAEHEHRNTIGAGVSRLITAGVPQQGAELDGEPISYGLAVFGGGIKHGDVRLQPVSD